MNDKNNDASKKKGQFIFILMAGIFMTLVGVMGFIRSPEVTDTVMLVSGLVMAGAGLYRLLVPPTK